jgi:hypothetical protein
MFWPRGARVTVDEELNLLEDQLRRLKIEYDAYFGGGAKKPPVETEWRVKSLIARYSDARMSFSQRFRYNAQAQRYAIFSDLWRKKMRVKEEGYQRPQDALLAVQGVRTEQEHEAARALKQSHGNVEGFSIVCSDPHKQDQEVRQLYDALLAARTRNGEELPDKGFKSFRAFVEKKTDELRKTRNCRSVEYSVELDNGKVRLKLKPKS